MAIYSYFVGDIKRIITKPNKMMITSPSNPKIKEVIKLRKSGERQKQDLIVIEGLKEIDMAVQAGIMPQTLFYSPDYARENRLPATVMNQEELVVAAHVFDKISWREHPDGFLVLARPRYLELEDIKLSKDPLLVVLEGLEKPGNLGAILRTADAAGVDAVIISDPQTDIYNPNVIRASLGTVFSNQVVVADRDRVAEWLKSKKIKIYATTPAVDTYYTEAEFTMSSAILIGAEHEGLSRQWLKLADEKIRIPMQGKIDSLNASVSAAIVIFEAIRQRKSNIID